MEIIRLLIIIMVISFMSGCSSTSKLIHQDQDMINGDLRLVKSYIETHSAGGLTKQTIKELGLPANQEVLNECNDIPALKLELQYVTSSYNNLIPYLGAKIYRYSTLNLTENQKREVDSLTFNYCLLRDLLEKDIRLAKNRLNYLVNLGCDVSNSPETSKNLTILRLGEAILMKSIEDYFNETKQSRDDYLKIKCP